MRLMRAIDWLADEFGGPRLARHAVEHGIDEAGLALIVEGVGDLDIFVDRHPGRHVATMQEFVGAGEQDRAHQPVDALPGPVLGQRRRHGLLELVLVRHGAFDDVLEQRPVGVAAHAALARLAGAHVQELLDDLRRGVFALLPLVEGLHRRQPRGLTTAWRGGGGPLGAHVFRRRPAGCRLSAHVFRQRRPSATMARQACAASPPLSPRSVAARAHAWSTLLTVTMPSPIAIFLWTVRSISPRALSPQT